MSEKVLRWGIVGAGIIAQKMADAIALDPDSMLVAVASKTLEKAEVFALRNAIEASADYQSLMDRADIDVIYVATTHNFHYENTCMALRHNKHVLVEKPFTVNAIQARSLVDLATERQCFMMEALWVRFLPSMIHLKELLNAGAIGDIRLFNMSFGNIAPEHYRPRLIDPHLAGGVTLDMGIYPITFVNFLLGALPMPSKSLCRMSDSGVDELAVYQFQYPSGCLATINTSFNLFTKSEAMIYGTTGYVEFPDFQEGPSFTVHTHEGNHKVVHSETFTLDNHENGFIYQVAEVVRQIRAGNLESPVIPLTETVKTMQLMDDMRAEWGFQYPFELADAFTDA